MRPHSTKSGIICLLWPLAHRECLDRLLIAQPKAFYLLAEATHPHRRCDSRPRDDKQARLRHAYQAACYTGEHVGEYILVDFDRDDREEDRKQRRTDQPAHYSSFSFFWLPPSRAP